jgi:hypothetical protein
MHPCLRPSSLSVHLRAGHDRYSARRLARRIGVYGNVRSPILRRIDRSARRVIAKFHTCQEQERRRRCFDETTGCAESPLRSLLTCNRISYRSCQSRRHASRFRRSPMLMHVEESSLESASCSRPASAELRSTASIGRAGDLFSTSSCSKRAWYRGFLTLATTLGDCMKVAPRILKDCVQARLGDTEPRELLRARALERCQCPLAFASVI